MIVLDTDHISILQHDSVAAAELRKRLLAAGDEITTSVITYEEQLRSWLTRLAQAREVHMTKSLSINDWRRWRISLETGN